MKLYLTLLFILNVCIASAQSIQTDSIPFVNDIKINPEYMKKLMSSVDYTEEQGVMRFEIVLDANGKPLSVTRKNYNVSTELCEKYEKALYEIVFDNKYKSKVRIIFPIKIKVK